MPCAPQSPTDTLWIFFAAKYDAFARRVEEAQQEIVTQAGQKATFVFQRVDDEVGMSDEISANVMCAFAHEKQADILGAPLPPPPSPVASPSV